MSYLYIQSNRIVCVIIGVVVVVVVLFYNASFFYSLQLTIVCRVYAHFYKCSIEEINKKKAQGKTILILQHFIITYTQCVR